MPDYSHLSTEVADTRYALAAHFLKGCSHIVEVGGHRLHDFLPGPTFFNVDPLAPQDEYWHKCFTYKTQVTSLNFENLLRSGWRNGLCCLGLEMYDEEYGEGIGLGSAHHLCTNMDRFDVLVLEYVESNQVARQQALLLCGAARATDMEVKLITETKWMHDGKYQEPNASFHKTRAFVVLEKP